METARNSNVVYNYSNSTNERERNNEIIFFVTEMSQFNVTLDVKITNSNLNY